MKRSCDDRYGRRNPVSPTDAGSDDEEIQFLGMTSICTGPKKAKVFPFAGFVNELEFELSLKC
jgi:hypothetical protein